MLRHSLALLVLGVFSCAPYRSSSPSPAALETLEQQIRARIAAVPGAEVGVAYRDLATHDSLDIDADSVFHAASTMKVPVMIELFRQAERGELSLDASVPLVNRFSSIVDGSSYTLDPGSDSDSSLYLKVGRPVSIRELVERMITRSSNLATNVLIERVGAPRADATARVLGATHTRVLRGVEDQKAFDAGLNNTTTPRDLAALMMAIQTGRAASRTGCDSMLAILRRQEFSAEIPAGLPPGTPVAHKTGSITAVLHDAAIVYPPAREPYVLVVLTKGIRREAVARAVIVDASRAVWRHAVKAP